VVILKAVLVAAVMVVVEAGVVSSCSNGDGKASPLEAA
jgi:hypothetical protein